MTTAMNWLKAKAPGFNNLSKDERDAITDFALLWGLFESRILNSRGNASAICAAVETWHAKGTLDPGMLNAELDYFETRYHANGAFTHHFDGLLLRGPDHEPMLRRVLSGADVDPRHRIAAALIIVYRYRNNLFHGPKWEYELADQLGNFNAANNTLMKMLERYGGLG